MSAFNSDLVASTVRISVPIMLAALGALIVLRAGMYNIALEGQMLVGSFVSVAVAYATGNSWLGVLAGALAGGLTSLIFAFAVLRYGANAIVASIAVNLLALGATGYLVRTLYGSATLQPIGLRAIPTITIPGIRSVPVIGPALSGQSATVYIAFVFVAITYVLLSRTNFGLAVRAVGEHPDAAKTAGISPNHIRLLANTYGGLLCGLAGAHLALGYASQFTDGMTQGRGYTAFSAAIFGQLSAVPTMGASLFFGFSEALGNSLQVEGVDINPHLLQIVPYVMAVLALSISTFTAMRRRGREKMREVNQS